MASPRTARELLSAAHAYRSHQHLPARAGDLEIVFLGYPLVAEHVVVDRHRRAHLPLLLRSEKQLEVLGEVVPLHVLEGVEPTTCAIRAVPPSVTRV